MSIPRKILSRLKRSIGGAPRQPERLHARHKWNSLECAHEFSIANNIVGDYLEFGCFKGNSLIHSYKYYHEQFDRYRGIQLGQGGEKTEFTEHERRFIVFDSFEGLPPHEEDDVPYHWKGAGVMACSLDRVKANLQNAGIDPEEFEFVQGYYEDSLTPGLVEEIGLKKAAVINIDCDLYESTVTVMNFLEPLLQDGTVIYFDDWFYYRGHPRKGEQGALNQWLEKNPKWTVSELSKHYPAATYIFNET